jgi:succinyl-diaminopimelate desuccinylase
MKGGLASMLGALRMLLDYGLPRRGRVLLTLVPDEETGGTAGTAYLWEKGLLKPGGLGMLMPEATSGVVWNGNRGALSTTVTVRGTPAHVGLAHEGVNSFRGLALAAQALFALQASVGRRLTDVPVDPPAARASVMLVGGQCGGGTNFNVVPSECWFTVDRRTNPEENLGECKAEIEAAVHEALASERFDVSFHHFQESESSVISPQTQVGDVLAGAILDVAGAAPSFGICPGVCEVRFFNRQGIPAYAYGPGILGVSHGPREYVEVTRLTECAAIYTLVAARLLGG